MNRDVMLALLALDAYNRGYGSNLNVSGTSLGSVRLLDRAELGVTANDYLNWQAAGFFAQAYDWNGETIISFRGTNFPIGLVH